MMSKLIFPTMFCSEYPADDLLVTYREWHRRELKPVFPASVV